MALKIIEFFANTTCFPGTLADQKRKEPKGRKKLRSKRTTVSQAISDFVIAESNATCRGAHTLKLLFFGCNRRRVNGVGNRLCTSSWYTNGFLILSHHPILFSISLAFSNSCCSRQQCLFFNSSRISLSRFAPLISRRQEGLGHRQHVTEDQKTSTSDTDAKNSIGSGGYDIRPPCLRISRYGFYLSVPHGTISLSATL